MRCLAFAPVLPVAFAFLLGTAHAQEVESEPKPYPGRDFTFKRVKPPSASTKKRITVQIGSAPRTPARAGVGVPADKVTATQPKTPADWFWTEVSPDFAATGPGRLAPAVQHVIAQGPEEGFAAPRLAALQGIADAFGTTILRETVGSPVSPALVLAVMTVESAGQPDAVSRAGATGLMQLMPATAERFGVKNALDPADNIRGAVKFLTFLMKKFDSDPVLILAAYNAGENSIAAHGGVPNYPETRNYVPKVLAAWSVARALCLTPPELITDGCAFAVRSAQK